MNSSDLVAQARAFLSAAEALNLRVVTAESCTAGLIAATLGRVPGASNVLERGFVTYSNDAKIEVLRVPQQMIAAHGAVSREVAISMAEGALRMSSADLAVAVTGIAGPGGGSAEKPVGLVHLAAVRRGAAPSHEEKRFGDLGREHVQNQTVAAAFALLTRLLT